MGGATVRSPDRVLGFPGPHKRGTGGTHQKWGVRGTPEWSNPYPVW